MIPHRSKTIYGGNELAGDPFHVWIRPGGEFEFGVRYPELGAGYHFNTPEELGVSRQTYYNPRELDKARQAWLEYASSNPANYIASVTGAYKDPNAPSVRKRIEGLKKFGFTETGRNGEMVFSGGQSINNMDAQQTRQRAELAYRQPAYSQLIDSVNDNDLMAMLAAY